MFRSLKVRILIGSFGWLLSAAFAAADPPSAAHESLQSTLWMQTSLEYQMLTRQTYAAASERLPDLIRDRSHTAAVEQVDGYQDLPPAVVMDVDETVLDNSAYQARTILAGGSYDPETWAAWVEQSAAAVVPGAAEFIHFAAGHGVAVFFVTNRDAGGKSATLANLRRELQIPIPTDRVLCKGERPEWTSDKSSRRSRVASTHRIVMLIGDDVNDFVTLTGGDPTDPSDRYLAPARRARVGATFATRFGRSWFLLPNPNYGSWDAALLVDSDASDRESQLSVKRQQLQPEGR